MPESTVEKSKFLAPLHAKTSYVIRTWHTLCIWNRFRNTIGYSRTSTCRIQLYAERRHLQRGRAALATRYAAELIRWDDKLGSIETGKLADIIAIDGNPMNDMGVMHRDNISFIMKDGVIYKDKGLFFHI